jgi:hypothetical protein
LIQPDNGHGDHGLVAGKKDFFDDLARDFRISPWFCILPESNAFGIQEASFCASLYEVFQWNLAGIQKARLIGGKAEWRG